MKVLVTAFERLGRQVPFYLKGHGHGGHRGHVGNGGHGHPKQRTPLAQSPKTNLPYNLYITQI